MGKAVKGPVHESIRFGQQSINELIVFVFAEKEIDPWKLKLLPQLALSQIACQTEEARKRFDPHNKTKTFWKAAILGGEADRLHRQKDLDCLCGRCRHCVPSGAIRRSPSISRTCQPRVGHLLNHARLSAGKPVLAADTRVANAVPGAEL